MEQRQADQVRKVEQQGQWKSTLQEQMRNNTSRHQGKKDLNYSLFSGMNERERQLNKAELE